MRWLVFTNAYVALCGAALTAASYPLVGADPRIDAVVATVFFATLVIYNLDRLVEPHPGHSVHERWIEQHRRALWLVTGMGMLGAAASASQLPMDVLFSLAVAGAVALGYCFKVVPGKTRWRRLKELPGAKLLLIAAVWTYATLGMPMLIEETGLDRHAVAALVSRFLFLAAVALPFDLPDMERDRQSGIATLPTLLSVRATRYTALALAGLSATAALLVDGPQAFALGSTGVAACALFAALRADRGVVYFMVLLDGMLLAQAGALWISTL